MIDTGRLAFLHCPKTGGTWVWRAIQEAGIKVDRRGAHHGTAAELFGKYRGRLVYTQVRHPKAWLASAYVFLCACRSWPGPGWLSRRIRGLPTVEFGTWLEAWYRSGLTVAGVFRLWTAGADMVGRTETCREDLGRALELAGHGRHALDLAPVNVHRSAELVAWTAELSGLVMEREREALEEWYDGKKT